MKNKKLLLLLISTAFLLTGFSRPVQIPASQPATEILENTSTAQETTAVFARLVFACVMVFLFVSLLRHQFKTSKKLDHANRMAADIEKEVDKIRLSVGDQVLIEQFYRNKQNALSYASKVKNWGAFNRIKAATAVVDQFASAKAAGGGSSNSVSAEIERLVQLRDAGQLSPEEFKAFSERFTRSSGQKANEILDAISRLHTQYKSNAMSEGNYKASLWSLMDKLDRS